VDRGEHVEVERGTQRVGLARASRLPVAAEIEGQHAESVLRQHPRLLLPTLLVETAPVSQHDAVVAFSVDVSVDEPSVLGRKGDALLRRGEPRQKETCQDRSKGEHWAIVLPTRDGFLG